MAKREPYELERPRRPRDDERAGRRARRLRARLRRGIGRPHALDPRARVRRPGAHWQRSMVKVSFARNGGKGAWRAHGRYLARDGAQRNREAPGLGFDADGGQIEVPARLAAWAEAGDDLVWKIIVSPENARRLDLPRHTRDLVGRMEIHLRTSLAWVAIEHDHSEHPHVHLVVRGVRDDGSPLGIDAAFVKHGLRHHSRDLATRELGPRTEQDQLRAREAGVGARYVGALDAEIEAAAGVDRRIRFDREPARRHPRHQLWRRLEVLEELGLAVRDGQSWEVDPEFRSGLRRLQQLGDVQRSLRDPAISLSEPRPDVRISQLASGQVLTGRVAGSLLDEGTDRAQLLLEATDGFLHVIRQTPALAARRGEGGLAVGTIVTLEGRTFLGDEGEMRPFLAFREHGSLDRLARDEQAGNVLDQAVIRAVRETGRLPEGATGRSRFARRFLDAARGRAGRLVSAGLLLDNDRGGRSFRLAQSVELERESERPAPRRTPPGAPRSR